MTEPLVMPLPLVSFHNVGVTLGGRPILKGVEGAVERGKITALIGLNGSGKTTLLRCILREIPYEGQITFHCGHDHSRPDPAQVGYVPQKLRIEAWLPLTVCDLFGLSLMRRPLFLGVPRRLREHMVAMLARLWLEERYLDMYVEKLSGGELQRVLLALALEPSPELLLLDEPAAGIDFAKAEPFYELLARLNRDNGLTILLVSHDLSIVSRHTHQVLCLRDGRIECHGPPGEVLQPEVREKIFGPGADVYSHTHTH
jgi:zinc transport system ATP-binding protein